ADMPTRATELVELTKHELYPLVHAATSSLEHDQLARLVPLAEAAGLNHPLAKHPSADHADGAVDLLRALAVLLADRNAPPVGTATGVEHVLTKRRVAVMGQEQGLQGLPLAAGCGRRGDVRCHALGSEGELPQLPAHVPRGRVP